jgi:uncharacterized iron-regulated membrane protein
VAGKQGWVALHRAMALGTGLVLAAMGITGSLLLYKGDIEASTHPERLVPAAPPHYEAVLATARAVAPGASRYTIHVPEAGHALKVDAAREDFVRMHIDPRDGRLISHGGRTDDWLDLVERLHTHLLAGDAGTFLVAALGAVLLLLVATGLIQAWPRRWSLLARVRWDAPSPWLAFDLHRLAGLAAALFLALNAATGIVMAFSATAARVVNRIAGSQRPADPAPPDTPVGAVRASLDEVVRAAQRAFRQGRVTRIVVSDANAPVEIRMRGADEPHPVGLGSVAVNPYDATVMSVTPLASLSAGQRMFEWIFPLHAGRLFGEAHRGVLLAAGISLPFLLASGLVVWARRRKARYKSG